MPKQTKIDRRLDKVAALRPGAVTKTSRPAVTKQTDASALADALTILADLPSLDGRADRDTVAARAAVTVAASPMANTPLVKAFGGEAAELLGKAADLARMPAAERASRRTVMAAIYDSSRGPDRVTFGRMLAEHDDMCAAITKTATPTLAKVAAPNSNADAMSKAADRAAADFQARFDQALEAARARQGGPRR